MTKAKILPLQASFLNHMWLRPLFKILRLQGPIFNRLLLRFLAKVLQPQVPSLNHLWLRSLLLFLTHVVLKNLQSLSYEEAQGSQVSAFPRI